MCSGFADYVKDKHPNAVFFLESSSSDDILYGSIADCSIEHILSFLLQAEQIVLVDTNINSELAATTYVLLHRLITVFNKKVVNFDHNIFENNYQNHTLYSHNINECPALAREIFNYHRDNNFLGLLDYRKTQLSQLWVAGCSYAAGSGLTDKKQSYANIVADSFGMKISTIAIGGANIQFSANQILRSNVGIDDIVLWGISGIHRHSFFNDNLSEIMMTSGRLMEIPFTKEQQKFIENTFINPNQVAVAIRSFLSVVDFCRQKKAKLFVLPHPELSLKSQYTQLAVFLESHPGFINLYGNMYNNIVNNGLNFNQLQYIDLSQDGIHPGPLTHYNWAEIILQKIKESI